MAEIISLAEARKVRANPHPASQKSETNFVEAFAELTLLWLGPEAYREFRADMAPYLNQGDKGTVSARSGAPMTRPFVIPPKPGEGPPKPPPIKWPK